VLAAGVVLVVANARRSGQLAARQMDFVAAVSHELRTPLAVIRSAAQNLSAGVVDDPARARRYGELIDDEGRRLSEMVEQVLAYAGLGDGGWVREARRVDVAALVDEVVAEWGPDITAAGFVVEVEGLDAADGGGPGAVPAVSGDPDALRRALHNLVGNALKHARSGQWLGIVVRAKPPGRPREVVIDVCDHGPGVEAGDLAHLFEPFYRGRRAVSQQVHGNGLGLSLVKAIVEAHGGGVSVRSGHGGGAVFTMRLPAAEPGAAGGAEADPVEDGAGESQMTGGDPAADGAEGSRSQACDPAAGGGGPA